MRLLRSLLACHAVSALQTSTIDAASRRPTQRPANFLESFAEAFANPPLSAPRKRPEAADELQRLVTDGWNGARVDADRCSQLIDALASMGGPFDASDLGGGLWLALHSRGPVPKWQKNQELLKVFGVRNRAGQTYFPKDKRVENYGEVVGGLVGDRRPSTTRRWRDRDAIVASARVRGRGDDVPVTPSPRTQVTFGAEGTFALPAGPLRAPCDLPVEIAAGGLTVFGKRFELPIAGPGLVRVLYHDSTMRIFESPLTSQDKWEESGLVVVQVRESAVINS